MWIIVGLVLGAAVLGLVLWLRSKNMTMTWYEWLIGAVGLALLLYTIQNFRGAFMEIEPTAAWMFMLIFGLPSLILLAVAWQLVLRRSRAT